MNAGPTERGAWSAEGAEGATKNDRAPRPAHTPDRQFIGWDVGGANTKVAAVSGGIVRAAHVRWYELQRAPHALPTLLAELAGRVGARAGDVHALTMTAELSQFFRLKRHGVDFVLDAVERAFPGQTVGVYTVDGCFLDVEGARREPIAVAAANWAATARAVALDVPDALLIDVGTTTADIIPIVGGRLAALGRTDPERLASGELVYSGALRTPVEAMADAVPFRGERAGVSAEGFALAGDVHLWRGDLATVDYTVPAPDGRPATREFAGERLARVVCGDSELLARGDVDAIADALADAQVARIASAIRRVHDRHPSLDRAVVTGLGDFIAARAAAAAGLHVDRLADSLGGDAARCAPAAAVALLMERLSDGDGRWA